MLKNELVAGEGRFCLGRFRALLLTRRAVPLIYSEYIYASFEMGQ
jgi:hypothetical protein